MLNSGPRSVSHEKGRRCQVLRSCSEVAGAQRGVDLSGDRRRGGQPWTYFGQAEVTNCGRTLTSAFPSIADKQRHAGQDGEHSDRQHPRDGMLKGHVLIDRETMKRKDDR